MPGDQILTEGNHSGDFIKELVSPTLCFEQIKVTGGKFPAGSVLCYNAEKWQAPDAAADNFCVLFASVDATAADMPGNGLMRLAAVKADFLEWPDAMTEEDKAAIVEKMKAAHLLVQ